MRFLLVEDSEKLSRAISERLVLDGHVVDSVSDIGAAEAMLHSTEYDMILLDLTLPDGHGWDLLKSLRARADKSPVIVITARSELTDRIETLDAGADDFIVKPFAFAELEARCRAVLRRKRGDASNKTALGNVEFDTLEGTLSIEGKSTSLRNQELRLFEALFSAPGRLQSKSFLLDRLFAFGSEGSDNAVEVYIGRLRKKLAQSNLEIETVRGRGYRLNICE
ncbi:response regulator transcription factor [Ruegeria halocynthiae]|uniref:response regulator transcription factor n=1 Tax=Ruegeria halocynthiae TaxID=985054 RepID=UPI00056C7FA7|nr:response regulator transcription factor [Ruegeria halocynthiae]